MQSGFYLEPSPTLVSHLIMHVGSAETGIVIQSCTADTAGAAQTGTAVFADAIIAAEIVTAILAFVNFLCHKLLLFFFIEVDGFFLDFDFLAGSDFFTGDHLGILIGETKGKADEGDGEDRDGDDDDDVGVLNLRKN